MASISSGSFFHYTKSIDSLLGIMSNGFRFSYCFEEFDEFVAHSDDDGYIPLSFPIGAKKQSVGISFPMVCFCDIPLMRAGNHRGLYGDYCIGLNKSIALAHYSPIINPVFYVNSFWVSDIYSKLTSLKKSLSKRAKKDEEFIKEIESASEGDIPELVKKGKLYFESLYAHNELGHTLEQLLRLTKPYVGENGDCYYDEREWRVFWNYNRGRCNNSKC